jgi:hypothetical protein
VEADGLVGPRGRIEKLIQQGEYLLELLRNRMVAIAHLRFQFRQTSRQFLVDTEQLSQPDKGPHNLDIDIHRPSAAEDAGEHRYPVLGEGKRWVATTAACDGT